MTDRDTSSSSSSSLTISPPQRVEQNTFGPVDPITSRNEPMVTIAKPNSLSLNEINMPLFKISNLPDVQDNNVNNNININNNNNINNNINNVNNNNNINNINNNNNINNSLINMNNNININNTNSNQLHSSLYHIDDQNLRERFESINFNNMPELKNKFQNLMADDGRDILEAQPQQLYNRTTPTTTTPLSNNSLLQQHQPQQQQQQQPYQPLQRSYFPSMLQNDQLNDNNQQQKHLQQFAGLLPLPQHQYLPSPYDLSPQDLPFFLNHPNFRYNTLNNNNNSNNSNNNIGGSSSNCNSNHNNFHAATSPKTDEMKSFLKSLRKTNLVNDGKKMDAEYNNVFYNDPSLEFSNSNPFDNFKLPNYMDSYDAANIAANSQLSEALILRLKQQNSLTKQQLNNTLLDLQLGGSNCRELLSRHFSLNNIPLVDQEKLARLYVNELVKENPNLVASHLLNNSTLTNLTYPLPGFTNGHVESFSRKVFVGGLPPDSDENEITASFRQFGPLIVDWPHKAETKTSFPPKGYCFLLFQDEMSVQKLMDACQEDDGKFYWCISSSLCKDKPVRRVQIRPWSLIDSDFLMDASQPLDLRKTVFVGGVPRPLKAAELAIAMDQLYGCVCYAGIDTDPELKYPKGAGRVSFSSQQSYISAISARFVQLQFGDIDKRVEVKPYVLDDQLCDECQGQKSAGKSAPYYCANVACLQYYCETCWVQIHSRPGREFHKPLVKEGADRPKSIPPFKW